MNCGNPNCGQYDCNCGAVLKNESHKYRQDIRQKLVDIIEQEAGAAGMSAAGLSRQLGIKRQNVGRVLSGQATIDAAVLYLRRLGVEVEFKIVSRGKAKTEENNNDDTGTFCA